MVFEYSELELKADSAYVPANNVPSQSIFLKSDKELSEYEQGKSLDRRLGMKAIRYLWTKSGAAKAYSFVLGHCPMEPHCSHYGYEAIAEHGLFKGIMLGYARTLRCNPSGWKNFSLKDGRVYDPIPKK